MNKKRILQKFVILLCQLDDTFKEKTETYGIDFFKENSIENWDDAYYGGLRRKWKRLEHFKKTDNEAQENIKETLKDMAIYCLMLAIAFDDE